MAWPVSQTTSTRVSGINWVHTQGFAVMLELLHGKSFFKRIGPKGREFGLVRNNMVIHRLLEPYANRGPLHRTSLATEVEQSIMARLIAHAMLDLTTNGQTSKSRRRLWRHV